MGTGARKKPTRKKKERLPKSKERLRPVSLHPLDFDAAMRGILAATKTVDQGGASQLGEGPKPRAETE